MYGLVSKLLQMKNICLILMLLLPFFAGAQVYQTIKPIEAGGSGEYGVYYKDFNNVFNGFEGTYEYSSPGFYFKIVLKKIFSNVGDYFYEDMIIGKYQYIKDGVEINYLNDNLIGVADDVGAKIKLGTIHPADPNFCEGCLNEKYLEGAIFDPITHNASSLYVSKKVYNGEQGIQLWFLLHAEEGKLENDFEEPIKLPIGEFFMRKIE